MARVSPNLAALAIIAVVAVVAVAGGGCPARQPATPLTFGVTPDDHAKFFPIVDGAVHELGRVAFDGAVDCASCHTSGSESFSDFSCLSCHEHRREGRDADGSEGMDALHAGKAGYAYDSKLCYGCHANGLAAELSRGEHDEYFPIDDGTAHRAFRCEECHTQPGVRAVVSCTTCHADDDADGRGEHELGPMVDVHGPELARLGYEWTTAKCLDCHARSQVPGELAHDPFPIADGTVHAGISCADCHASRGDRRDLTCVGCHTQVDDGAGPSDVHGEARMFTVHSVQAGESGLIEGYEFVSRTCFACHQDAQVPGTINHEEFFPIGAGSVHALGTSIDDVDGDGFPPVLVECTSCHQSQTFAEVTCTTCHAHAEQVIAPVHANFPDYAYASTACVFCHSGGVRRFDHATAATFPVSALADTHHLDDPATAALDGLTCADCHASQTNRRQMRCATCHDHDQPTSLAQHGNEMQRFGYIWQSDACLACHATSQVPGLLDHEPAFPLLPPSGNGAHQGLACIDCHTDTNDRTASLSCTACHEPTSPADDREVHGEQRLGEVHTAFVEYVWAPASCIGCHADGTAAGAGANFDHVWFPVEIGNHALTSRGGALECIDCHAVPADYTVETLSCITCHLTVDDGEGAGAQEVHGLERMTETHAIVDGYEHVSATCLECHPNGEPAGNFVHIDFPIAVGTQHAGIGCSECHAAGAPKNDLAALQCKQCHDTTVNLNPTVAQIHQGQPDFVDASPGCYGCHPNAEPSPPFDHDAFFPIAAGTPHQTIACADCHINPSRRLDVTCTGCHTDEDGDGLFDHDVAAMLASHGPDMASMGYEWTTAACRSCHARSEVPGVLDHDAAFPISSAAASGTHAGLACNACHASVQDRTALACVTCHTQVNDGGGPLDVHGEQRMREQHLDGAVPGYTFDSQSCFGCHQQAQVPGTMDHERFFPIGAGTTHELGSTTVDTPAVLIECITCHEDQGNARNVSCTGCHAHDEPVMEPTHGAFPGYLWESASCVFCHQDGQPRIDHPFFPVANGDPHALDEPTTPAIDGITCTECHASQTNRTLLTCTSCHEHTPQLSTADHGASMSQFGYRYEAGACFDCHRTSQVPGLFDHEPIYPLLPPSGAGAHQELVCIDCHASRTDRAASLTCTACHEPTSATDAREVHGQPRMDEAHDGFPNYQWTPRSCVGCHVDGTAASGALNLDHVWFPISAGLTHAVSSAGGDIECVDCHTTPGNFAVFDCTACHQTVVDPGQAAREVHSQQRMAQKHAAVSGYAFQSPLCLECHPNGEPIGNFDHTGFPIAAGTKHVGIGCNDCHVAGAARTDNTQLLCSTCHATVDTNPTIAVIHTGVPNFANTSPACLSCHPNAEQVGAMDHAAYFPVQAGSVHASAAYNAKIAAGQNACTACHASRTNRADERCSTCHATVAPLPPAAHTRVRGFANNSPACKRCHADAQVDRLSAHTVFDPRHEGASCTQCHRTSRTDKPWATNFAVADCRACHSATCTLQNQGPCD